MDGEISSEELHAALEAGDELRIVDIRSPAAFARGHIPGSENIPFGELPQRVEELESAPRVVTVCPHGQASIQAARLIGSYEGTKETVVESLSDGMTGWAEAYEVESADVEETDAPF
ncbi:rhodanese-like domain-containing protein [Natronomonas sp. EA1]|uniref:rhodanese-like domain-containing protein n=1 Tax=Natronomonas sp. EA1 TaxID=3421655 RepID=UPI003EBEC56C